MQPLTDSNTTDLTIYQILYNLHDRWMNNIEDDILVIIECKNGIVGIHKSLLENFEYFNRLLSGNWKRESIKMDFDANILKFFRKDLYLSGANETLFKSINCVELIKFMDYILAPKCMIESYIGYMLHFYKDNILEITNFLEKNNVELSDKSKDMIFEYCLNNYLNEKLVHAFLSNMPEYLSKWCSLTLGNINYVEVKITKDFNYDAIPYGFKSSIVFSRIIMRSYTQIPGSYRYRLIYFIDDATCNSFFNYLKKRFPRVECMISRVDNMINHDDDLIRTDSN